MTQTQGVAVVTGAGSGIGKATALKLLAAGWRVALAGRRLEPLKQTIDSAPSGHRAISVVADVTDPVAVTRLFQETVTSFGRVDLLFNNAGVSSAATPIEDLELDEWNRVVQTNLTGMFICLREAFRVMKAQTPQGGRIINNGSIAATSPRPGSIAYTATKHAVTGLTKQGSLDGRRLNIAVGQIDIGNAATPLAARMATGVQQANGEIAAEPMIDVEIAADSVVYMASLPLEANVLFHTVMATKMPFVGRG